MSSLLSWVVDWSSIAENRTRSIAVEPSLYNANTDMPKIAIEIKPHSQDLTFFGIHFDRSTRLISQPPSANQKECRITALQTLRTPISDGNGYHI
jgi:hypothetical protein